MIELTRINGALQSEPLRWSVDPHEVVSVMEGDGAHNAEAGHAWVTCAGTSSWVTESYELVLALIAAIGGMFYFKMQASTATKTVTIVVSELSLNVTVGMRRFGSAERVNRRFVSS